MTGSSLALNNLRGVVIVVVLAFHSVLAYLGSLPEKAEGFNVPPYQWRAFPIIDTHRWFGFDLFCAWQDVYLMALMFFLSALFTWPSLTRKGAGRFLYDRFRRIGVPFGVGAALLMPIALYPSYVVTADDPSVAAYWRALTDLPFWPNGPQWFLCLLFGFNIAAAGLYVYAPGAVLRFGVLLARLREQPGKCFLGLTLVSAIVYVPLALAFTPWDWYRVGPFSIQTSRTLFYPLYFMAGLGVGMFGLEKGMLAPQGALARHWRRFGLIAFGTFGAWIGLTGLTMKLGTASPAILEIAAGLCFVSACAGGCFFVIALALRFGRIRVPLLDGLAENAYGMYLVHYIFVVWLQYLLLDTPLYSIAKAAIVFGGTLALSWLSVAALRAIPFGPIFIGADPRLPAKPLAPAG